MYSVDLSGKWRYALEEDGNIPDFRQDLEGEGFILPGTTCENRIGKKQEYYTTLNEKTVRAPRERYEYVGGLWLQREVEVPKEAENKRIYLFLERVNMASELWIDGEKIQRQVIGLSTPHIYDLTGKVTAGKHTFVLRIDNRNLINIDTMASGYSVDTQGYWNGIVGRIELQWKNLCTIENVQVYPKENGIRVRLIENSDIRSPLQREKAEITLRVIAPNGKRLKIKGYEREVCQSKQVEYFEYEIDADEIKWWDEFSPSLYTLQVKYTYKNEVSCKEVIFGMRNLEVIDKEIVLNHRRIALRGTTDCAIFPMTGYPVMDIESWREKFRIVKNYGLNHVRFHAWCPPENAFAAADELGVYLSVEMPLWLNYDVCALEVGSDPIHREYFMQEALNIAKTYGNHPSFMFFSNGNENMGDMELLEDILTTVKAYDHRRLYTMSSNFDHPILPCEDYLCAYEAGGNYVRMQNLQEEAARDTCLNYDFAAEKMSVPVISFEIGQYCSFPDVDIADRYTGNMLPVNFEVIRRKMQEKGVYHRLDDYVKASGDLVVKLYKEEIECALRTRSFGGFQLLALNDYTGQDTAIVGILDAFWQSKGFITAEKFREFCGPVVPLFKAKRIYKNTETIEAELALYDYGKVRIENVEYIVNIYQENRLFFQKRTRSSQLDISLQSIQKSTILQVEIAVGEYKNFYRIFVGIEKEQQSKEDLLICRKRDELQRILQEGKNAVVSAEILKYTLECSFIPVFWSPVFFESSKPCGGIIRKSHPIFSDFPTEKYPDYQWKSLLDNAKSVDISGIAKKLSPLVEMVPNFVNLTQSSPLFEVRVNQSNLLICGFDLESDEDMTKQLKYSIFSYMQSEDFVPEYEMTIEEFEKQFL
ncbi:MAG: hypothetical protein J6A75_09780 [Lachnospiraceae bacterium]|nr:hypothetical protein [Lachnospiraceae bacterium]